MISLSPRLVGAKCAQLALAFATLSPALFAPVLFTPALRAQGQLSREITFVRALAKEMRFIELAKIESDRLASEFRGAGDQDKIAQLAVEIAYYGARSRSDRTQQRQLFKETVEKSHELVERTNDDSVKLEALSTLAYASEDFGQFLIEELEIARSEDPDRVKDLQEEASKVLRGGIEACGKVKAAYSTQRDDPEKDFEFHRMWLKEGVLTREQGRADKENRSVLVERAIEELTEMVLSAGEETALGLRGMFEIAQCYEVISQMDDAISAYQDAIDQIGSALDLDEKGEIDLGPEMCQYLFEMQQEIYVRAAETMAREGAEGTAELFAAFHAGVKKYGAEGMEEFDAVSPTFGHQMLLAEARFEAESGDPQKVQAALAMAQRINDKHPSDFVGIRAKAVLRDILKLQQGLVSGTLMVEVGKGELQNQNFEGAIKSLRKAVAAMTDAEMKEIGMQAYQMLGQAFARTDRYIEAILAMQEGIKAFKSSGKKDEALDAAASDLGDMLDRTVTLHKRMTKDDEFFRSFWQEATAAASTVSTGGANKLAYQEGSKLLEAGKYREAAEQFAKVMPDYINYEQAAARKARALSAAGDFAQSRAATEEYRAYVAANELSQRDTGKQQVRTAAIALVDFNEVLMAYYEARGHEEFKLPQTLANYDAAIAKLQSFLSNHAQDGDTYVPIALAFLGRLQADAGDFAGAEATYMALKKSDSTKASRLATEIFKEYETKQELLTQELNSAISQDKGDAAINEARGRMTDIVRKLTTLGTDYIQASPRPQLGIMLATMRGWEQLGRWPEVDQVAKKTIELYGDDDASKAVVDKLVRPMVGEALLQQRRFQEAYDMLVAAEKATPNDFTLKRQIARALGGWFEIKNGQTVREPGLDRPLEAYMKYYGHPTESYRVWFESRDDFQPFTLEWYEYIWEAFWFAKQAGLKDSKYNDTAATFYRKARSTNDFATLKSYGEKGLQLLLFFQNNR